MKRCIFTIMSILLVLSFTSCQSNTTSGNETTKTTTSASETETIAPIVEYPEEIANIEDFKCVCKINDDESFVIEGDKAKALYTYLKEQQNNGIEEEIVVLEQESIHLIFQYGEPVVLQNQYPAVQDPLDLENPDSIEDADARFYGDYVLFENDYISASASPATSFAVSLKLPDGTYNKVAEMIAE